MKPVPIKPPINPQVAYLFDIEDHEAHLYHGCGDVRVEMSIESNQLLSLTYVDEPDPQPPVRSGPKLCFDAMASCHQLIVLHGTPEAAVLGVVLSRRAGPG